MATTKSRGRAYEDPYEQLGRWKGARQKAHSEYVKLLTERKNSLLALQIDHGPRSDAYTNARRELERNESQFERIQAVVRRPVNKYAIAPWAFWIFALALAIFEAPVNKFLFDYAIQGSNLTSYIVSTVFAVLLLLISHIAGRCIRQIWSEFRRRVVWSNLIISILAVIGLALIVSILTIGRARYSAGAADPTGFGGLFDEVSKQVGDLGFFGSLTAAFSDISALILFTINFGGILTAMALGYFSHDPDKDFDHAQSALAVSEKKITRLQKRYAKSRAKVIRGFGPDLTGASRNYAEANNRIIELKTTLGEPLDSQDEFILDSLDNLAEESEENEDVKRDHQRREEPPTAEPLNVTPLKK